MRQGSRKQWPRWSHRRCPGRESLRHSKGPFSIHSGTGKLTWCQTRELLERPQSAIFHTECQYRVPSSTGWSPGAPDLLVRVLRPQLQPIESLLACGTNGEFRTEKSYRLVMQVSNKGVTIAIFCRGDGRLGFDDRVNAADCTAVSVVQQV